MLSGWVAGLRNNVPRFVCVRMITGRCQNAEWVGGRPQKQCTKVCLCQDDNGKMLGPGCVWTGSLDAELVTGLSVNVPKVPKFPDTQ